MFHIPSRNADVLHYLRKQRALRILLFLGWITLLTLAAVYFNHTHRASVLPKIIGWRLLVWIAFALVSGVLLFRIPSLFTDRSFEGEIVRSSLSHTYSASGDSKNETEGNYNFRLNTVLQVRCTDGKLRKLRFEQKPGFFLYYHEGNTICHLAGLPYPVADPARMTAPPRRKWTPDEDSTGSTLTDPQKAFLCVACGHFYPTPTRCENCGLSLIDPKDIFEEKK